MTEIQKLHGPFAHAIQGGFKGQTHVVTCDGGDRCRMVRDSYDREWLQAVLRDRDVQASVRSAAERRLRQLSREAKPQ